MASYERSFRSSAKEIITKKHKLRKKLSWLAKCARTLAMAGMLGGLGAGGIEYGLEKITETKDQAQYEQTISAEAQKQEAEAEKLFGDNLKEGLKLFDAKPNDLLAANPSAHEPETETTEKTFVGSIATKEGQLDANIMRGIVQETFPKGWINNEIERIEFEEKEEYIEYEGVKSRALATCYRNGRQNNKQKDEIIFHKAAERTAPYDLVHTISHEVAHANDWVSDNEMTITEKTALAVKIGRRVGASNRFMSSYVESIQYENDDKRTRYYRTMEYWAVICEQFFKDATKLHVEDYKIIAAHIRKTDPNFSWVAAAKRRQELVFQLVHEQSQRIEQNSATGNVMSSPDQQ